LTVVSKLQTPLGIDRRDLISGVVRVLAEHQFKSEADLNPARRVLPVAVRFEAPGCDRPIDVVTIHINLHEAPLFDAAIGTAGTRQFVYLDRIWTEENRLGMRLTWLRHKVLSFLGLGRLEAITLGLLVISPSGCHAAQAIDWSKVWDKRTIARS
jgi:hypothetical protein